MHHINSNKSHILTKTSKNIPSHIAIILDGNGRWAQKKGLPRIVGHTRGVDAVRSTIENCVKRDIKYLTLFAFSSENWSRPEEEVSFLIQLFISLLEKEVNNMHKNNIRLRIIGDISCFNEYIRNLIYCGESKTAKNTSINLTIAANYGGRWDILQATRKIVQSALAAGHIDKIDEHVFEQNLSMVEIPPPDLFIRTGGEKRISNFLLWQLAYTELYFTDLLWPDFNENALEIACQAYSKRERRFGRISSQLQQELYLL